jgi:hypothetical protein
MFGAFYFGQSFPAESVESNQPITVRAGQGGGFGAFYFGQSFHGQSVWPVDIIVEVHGGFRPPRRVKPARRDTVPTHRSAFVVFDGESTFYARLSGHATVSARFTRTNQMTARVRGRAFPRISATVPSGTRVAIKASGRGAMRMRGRLSAQTVMAGHSTERFKAVTVENPPENILEILS